MGLGIFLIKFVMRELYESSWGFIGDTPSELFTKYQDNLFCLIKFIIQQKKILIRFVI